MGGKIWHFEFTREQVEKHGRVLLTPREHYKSQNEITVNCFNISPDCTGSYSRIRIREVVKGRKCLPCGKVERAKMFHDYYYEKASKEVIKNGSVLLTPSSEFRRQTNITIVCPECLEPWKGTSIQHLKERGRCGSCGEAKRVQNARSKGYKNTVHQLSKLGIVLISPTCEEEYTNQENIVTICQGCGELRTTSLNRIMNGATCSQCKLTVQVNSMRVRGYGIVVRKLATTDVVLRTTFEEYTTQDEIVVDCPSCGDAWQTTLTAALNGHSCRPCGYEKWFKSNKKRYIHTQLYDLHI